MIHLTIIAILKVLSPNIVKFRSTREQDFNRGIWRENRTQSLLLLLLFSHQVMSNSTSFYVPHHSQSLPSSCPSNWWCHQLSYRLSVELFFCLQSFPASGSFQMSQLFASGGWNIGVSVSASILPMNIQGWVSFRLTGLISLLFKGLSRVFASITVWKHQFFSALLSLWSSSCICTWLLERPFYMELCKEMSILF